MHDFMLAKEIIDELKKIVKEKKLTAVKKVNIEIGQVALAHDDYAEHTEDISIENLEFGLKNIAKDTPFEKTEFEIKKIAGESWKITGVEI